MDMNRPIGKHTVAEVRGDERALADIAAITDLAVDRVVSTVASARGATQVRNAFREHWPWTAAALGSRSVAFVRDYDLREELRRVTGATRILVSKRLNSGPGRQLVRNLFWDWWPEDEKAVSIPTEAETTRLDEAEREAAAPQEPPAPTAGTLLSGRYELRRRLGQGGFGTTWEAHDRLTEMDLVVKIPHADDGGAIRNELKQAFRLNHPNICQSFPERDDDTGRPFLVLHHGGEDLVQRLERHGNQPFPVTLAVHVLVSIADALDYLHDRSTLHLDVTPKNILIDEDDTVRLTDFGASAQSRGHIAEDGHRTRLATSLHSFNHCYAAPENFDGIGRSRSDQYSLFLVFCSLLEGRPRTTHSASHEVRYYDVLSKAQNEIVRRALSRDPDQRFDTCAEAARALADDLANVPAHVLAEDVQRLRQDFVRRVEREHLRVSEGTTRLGGALKLGRGLERLLQASILSLASTEGFDALAAIREFDVHATSIDRVTAGILVKTLSQRCANLSGGIWQDDSFLRDIQDRRSSSVWALINARNDVIHGRRPAEAIIPSAAAVADLLRGRPRAD